MKRSAPGLFAFLLVAGLLALSTGEAPPAVSSEPSVGTAVAKDEGSDSLSYERSVPPGTGSSAEECQDGVNADTFTLTVQGTSDAFYRNHSAQLMARIDWDPSSADPASSDLALIVRKDGATLSSSDGGEPSESVLLNNPKPGEYQLIACAFSNAAPQPYDAKIQLNSTSAAVEKLPAASPSDGLKFMPIVTVDPQRDVAEPSLRVDKKGNIYACGPFGSSRAADYAQKSEDNGDTFRVLGEPPEGRIAPGGGGDCELSIAPEKNEQGNYTLSYVGLEALANFSTGRSTDEGKVFEATPTSESPVLVDRQWLEATGKDEVYLFYNQIPFGGTLQRSTDGGLTYAPVGEPGNAAPDIFRPGNIIIDHDKSHNPDGLDNETVYIIYTDDNKVMVSRSTDDGQTFKRFVAGIGQGNPANLFPSIDIDTAGNLYATWIEKGSFNVYYSYSKDRGESWSRKQLVNRKGASSNTMPWVAVGDPGRIAISFYCSPVDGNPELGTFRAPWHVCVNQSTNALSGSADFSQVRATHHPIHWDSICLSGLGCNVSNPPGDRTLLDFFQIRVDPRDGRVMVVFNESNKKPGDPVGPIAIVTYTKQKSGPSLYRSQGRVPVDRRAIFRSSSVDRAGDALFDFSSLGPPEPRRSNVKALDIRNVAVSRTSIGPKKRPGLKITMKTSDLSDAALTTALAEMESQELKFVVRWFSAYRPDYVVANWRPGLGFSFFEGNLAREITADGKLQTYPAPGRSAIPGKVNVEEGTITMKLGYRQIQDFDYGKTLTAEPKVGVARPGDRIYEVTGFTFGRPQPQREVLDYYNQADSTASFDHKLR